LNSLGPLYEAGIFFFGIEWGSDMAVHCLFVVKYWATSQKAKLSYHNIKTRKMDLYQAGLLIFLLSWTAVSMILVVVHYWDPVKDYKWFTTRPWKLGLVSNTPPVLFCVLLCWAFWTMKNLELNDKVVS
jgi:hypothetical protein